MLCLGKKKKSFNESDGQKQWRKGAIRFTLLACFTFVGNHHITTIPLIAPPLTCTHVCLPASIGDHGLVGRPVAQRGLRVLDPVLRPRRALP